MVYVLCGSYNFIPYLWCIYYVVSISVYCIYAVHTLCLVQLYIECTNPLKLVYALNI